MESIMKQKINIDHFIVFCSELENNVYEFQINFDVER